MFKKFAELRSSSGTSTNLGYDFGVFFEELAKRGEVDVAIAPTEDGFSPLGVSRGCCGEVLRGGENSGGNHEALGEQLCFMFLFNHHSFRMEQIKLSGSCKKSGLLLGDGFFYLL